MRHSSQGTASCLLSPTDVVCVQVEALKPVKMAWNKVCFAAQGAFFCAPCLLTSMPTKTHNLHAMQQPSESSGAAAVASTPSVWPSLRDAKEQKVVKKAAPGPVSWPLASERPVQPAMHWLCRMNPRRLQMCQPCSFLHSQCCRPTFETTRL